MLVVLGILVYLLIGTAFSIYLYCLLQYTKYFEPGFIFLGGVIWPLFLVVLVGLSVYYKIKR